MRSSRFNKSIVSKSIKKSKSTHFTLLIIALKHVLALIQISSVSLLWPVPDNFKFHALELQGYGQQKPRKGIWPQTIRIHRSHQMEHTKACNSIQEKGIYFRKRLLMSPVRTKICLHQYPILKIVETFAGCKNFQLQKQD